VEREVPAKLEAPAPRRADEPVLGRVYGESVLQRVPVGRAPIAVAWDSERFTAADFERCRIGDAAAVLGDAELWAQSGESVVLEICKTTPERAAQIAEWIMRTPLVADIVARRVGHWGVPLPCVDFLAHSFFGDAKPTVDIVSTDDGSWLIAAPLRFDGAVSDASGKSMPAALTRALCSLRPNVAWPEELFALFVSPTLPFVRELAPPAFWDALLKEGRPTSVTKDAERVAWSPHVASILLMREKTPDKVSFASVDQPLLFVGVKLKKAPDANGGARARLGEAVAVAAQLHRFSPRSDLAKVTNVCKQVAAGTRATPSLSWRCFTPSDLDFNDEMCRALVNLVAQSPNLAVVDLFGTTGVCASTVKALTDLPHVHAVGVAATEHYDAIRNTADRAKLVIVPGNERFKHFQPGTPDFDLHRRFEAFQYGLVYALRQAE
jgi:hypothetical protein